MKNKIKSAAAVILAVVLLLTMSSGITLAADGGTAPEKAGLTVTGTSLTGQKGFQGNVFYLTSGQLETIKDGRSNSATGACSIGSSWIDDAVYSSHESHGTGQYHASRVRGLDIETMLKALGVDTANLQELYYYSSDGFSSRITADSGKSLFSGRYYFDPKNPGNPAEVKPAIALYKSDNYDGNFADVTAPVSAARLAEGENVFVFGQKVNNEDNNCQYAKYVDALVLDGNPEALQSDNGQFNNMSIQQLIRLGIYRTAYTYSETAGGSAVYNIEGAPLSAVMKKMDVEGSRVFVKNAAGEMTELQESDISRSFVAWGYTDSTDTPAAQTGMYALYTPGGIIYNLTNITAPPAAPSGLSAAASGCSSVSLKWTAAADADGYEVYCAEGSGGYSKVAETEACQYADTGLKTGTGYSYKVCAYISSGKDKIKGDCSSSAAVTPSLEKTKITALKKKGPRKVLLKWQKISGATGYKIVYGRNSKITRNKKTVYTGACSKTFGKLKKHKKYYFKVCACRTVGGKRICGSWSKIKSIKR